MRAGEYRSDCRARDFPRFRIIGIAEELAADAEKRTLAREAFSSVGDDNAAAHAAAVRQEVLAEMREAAERCVRVRASALLLDWGIDRYRREQRGPC